MKPGCCLRILAALCTAFAAACSLNPVAGGGSDLPNGRVSRVEGAVVRPDSTPVDSCTVMLRKIVITAFGDSIWQEIPVFTNSNGVFRIYEADSGTWVLFTECDKEGISAVNQYVTVPETGTVSLPPLIMHSYAELIGHILLPPGADFSGMRVFIPGIQRSVPVDKLGTFILPQTPRGTFDIGIVYNRTGNFTRITADADSMRIIFVRNVEFAMMDIMADGPYACHKTTLEKAYYVSPKAYAPELVPEWYSTVDMNNVAYYSHKRDGSYVPWSGEVMRVYDFVAGGAVTRTSSGQVTLTTSNGEILNLTGDKIAWVDNRIHNVVVALIARSNNMTGEAFFEVVDVREFLQ